MARELEKVVTTKITRGAREGDPIAAQLREGMPPVGTLTPSGYVSAILAVGIMNLELHVFKRTKSFGNFSKVGEIMEGDMNPDTIEPWIMQVWGPGLYQLRPVVRGNYYAPTCIPFRVGEESTVDPPAGISTVADQGDVDTAIQEMTKRLGHMAVLRDFKKLASEPDTKKGDDMDMMAVQTMITASQAPLIRMLESAETRAQRAEDRVATLIDKMMDQRAQANVAQQPLFAELAKTALGKPEILSLLMGSGTPAEGENWVSLIKDVAREFAPVMNTIIMQMMEKGAIPHGAPAAPHAMGPAPTPLPAGRAARSADDLRPTGTGPSTDPAPGGSAMPMELNEEQQMSRSLIVRFIQEGDHPNAFATLETFPGFAPIPGGAMPMGEFIISRIDPAVRPEVYVPQLAMLFPELRSMIPAAVAFVKWAQDKILKDDEAMKQAENARTGQGESHG